MTSISYITIDTSQFDAVALSSTSTTSTSRSNPPSPVGLILGLIFGLLFLVAIVLLLVRRHFILKRTRENGLNTTQLTPAKARLANAGFGGFPFGFGGRKSPPAEPERPNLKLQISGPSNFTHVGSGVLAMNDNRGGLTSQSGMARPNPDGNSADRMKQKYPFDMVASLESGLGNHMETMRGTRRPGGI